MSSSFGSNEGAAKAGVAGTEEKTDDGLGKSIAPPAKRRATAAAVFDRIAASCRTLKEVAAASGAAVDAAIADVFAEVEAGRAFLVDRETPSSTAGAAGTAATTAAVATAPDLPTASTRQGAAAPGGRDPVPDWAAEALTPHRSKPKNVKKAVKLVTEGLEQALSSEQYKGLVKVGNLAVPMEKVIRALDVIDIFPSCLPDYLDWYLFDKEEVDGDGNWELDKVVRDVVNKFGQGVAAAPDSPTASTHQGAASSGGRDPVPDWASPNFLAEFMAPRRLSKQPTSVEKAVRLVTEGLEQALLSEQYKGLVKVGNSSVPKVAVYHTLGVIEGYTGCLQNYLVDMYRFDEEEVDGDGDWDLDKVVRDVVHEFAQSCFK
jgi:hypothetical protein